jgi:hypothetical protein
MLTSQARAKISIEETDSQAPKAYNAFTLEVFHPSIRTSWMEGDSSPPHLLLALPHALTLITNPDPRIKM